MITKEKLGLLTEDELIAFAHAIGLPELAAPDHECYKNQDMMGDWVDDAYTPEFKRAVNKLID